MKDNRIYSFEINVSQVEYSQSLSSGKDIPFLCLRSLDKRLSMQRMRSLTKSAKSPTGHRDSTCKKKYFHKKLKNAFLSIKEKEKKHYVCIKTIKKILFCFDTEKV